MAIPSKIRFNDFSVRVSFNKLMRQITSDVISEINSALGTTYTLEYFPNRHDEEFNSVTTWFTASSGKNRHRSGLVSSRVQIDIRIREDNTIERERLASLIPNGIDSALNLSTERNDFYSYFDVFDYMSNLDPKPLLDKARIEPYVRAGWEEVRDEDKTVTRIVNTYQILHRSR